MPTLAQLKAKCPTLAAMLPPAELAALVDMLRVPEPELYTIKAAAKALGIGRTTLWAWIKMGGVFAPGRDERGEPIYTRQHLDLIVAVRGGLKSKADADAEWALMARVQSAPPTVRKRKDYTRRVANASA